MKRIASIFFCWLAVLAAQGTININTRADVTGQAAAVQVTTSGSARWLMILAPTTNSAVIRCGDSNVSTSRGTPVANGAGLFFPPIPPDSQTAINLYNLANIYCYVGSGDKVSFTWAN